MGNAYGQYLSYVPLSNAKDRAFTEFSPLHPEFHRINTNIVNRVSIKLFKVDGRAPRLLYPDAFNTTYLTLAFRKKTRKEDNKSVLNRL